MESDDLSVEAGNPLRADGDALLQPIPCRNPRTAFWLENFFEAAGERVKEVLEEQLPLRIGNVAVTQGGGLGFRRIVHLPVQSAPGAPTTTKNLRVALRSGLVAADEEDVDAVVMPRLLPPDQRGNLDGSTVLETILEDLLQYPPVHFSRVTVVDPDGEWIARVREELLKPR